jgi:tetratricopeptide (TPR) repeat protein
VATARGDMRGMVAGTDRWGTAVHGASERAVVLLDDAIESLVALAGDPVAGAEAAVAADGDLVLGQVFLAYLSLYATTPAGIDAATTRLAGLDGAAERAGQREALHLLAARSWATGNWAAAARALERALVLNPGDLLALKIAQDLYFFLGRRLDLRDVAARVLRAWPAGQPGWGYVQGIYAFGLEENADYRQAETRARTALSQNPRDVWAVHALAHVFEMEGSQQAGIAFLTATAPQWTPSFFAVHNWWHRALYHLELGETDQVLALYDQFIRGHRSAEWLDVVDASALLWRLSLFGADVAGRAAELAADVEPLMDGRPLYIFNDWHAVMAFGLDGRHPRNERVLADNRRLAAGTNRAAADLAGLALLDGFSAFAAGRPEQALAEMIDIRQAASAVGGSHAQRDVIDLTLIAAAARAGDRGLARALADERVARKPAAAGATRQLLAANGL